MTQDMLGALRAIDQSVLADVVRQDQRSPTFEILNWSVERFGDKAIANAGTLFSFSGEGRDEQGIRPWTVVVKTFQKPNVELDARHLRYWKRELLAMQSGLLASLPGPITTPRCYGTHEADGSGWVWMEHIVESLNSRWTKDQYVFAAHELGCFNGRCLEMTIPDYPWLCKSQVQDKVEMLPPHDAWNSPFVDPSFSKETRQRVLRLWDERNHFYDALTTLPQTFSHFDCHRRNLITRRQEDGNNQIVALDWAWCGYGALGADLYALVGGGALIFEIETGDLAEIEAAAFEAYIAGLRETGWAGNPEVVRLAYTVYFAMFLAVAAPAGIGYGTSDELTAFVEYQFRRSRAEIASGWAALCELALDRADKARKLMDRLL